MAALLLHIHFMLAHCHIAGVLGSDRVTDNVISSICCEKKKVVIDILICKWPWGREELLHNLSNQCHPPTW